LEITLGRKRRSSSGGSTAPNARLTRLKGADKTVSRPPSRFVQSHHPGLGTPFVDRSPDPRRPPLEAVMRYWLLSFFLLAAIPSARAATINVPADYPTIQAAIDAAVNGDEILVAPGTYVESIDFKGKTITVRSSGGPDLTTIDGSNGYRVITMRNGEGP